MQFMMSKENQILMAPYEEPVLIEAARDKRSLEIQPVNYEVFVDALDYGRSWVSTRGTDKVFETLNPQLAAVLAGKKSFEEAMARVEKVAQTFLK